MKAHNKRKKLKHWTKPKWHYRNFFGTNFFILKTVSMKEKFKSGNLFFYILIVSSNARCLNGTYI